MKSKILHGLFLLLEFFSLNPTGPQGTVLSNLMRTNVGHFPGNCLQLNIGTLKEKFFNGMVKI